MRDQPQPLGTPYAGRERRHAQPWPVSRMCVRCGHVTPSSADVLCATCDEIARRPVMDDPLAPARGFVIGAMIGLAFWLAVIVLCMVIA